MQKVIQSNEFIEFKNDLNEVMKKINEVKNEINVDVKIKYNLEKYNQIIEGSDEDVLKQYETWYNQLSGIVIAGNNTINQTYEAKEQLEEVLKLINKEIENNDEIKVTLNTLVYKMIDKETIIFNKSNKIVKKGKKLSTKFDKEEFDEKLKELNNLKYQYDTNELRVLFQISNEERFDFVSSINKLKEWSGKQKYSIIFDSKIDGDGKGVLENRIINKKNLYFISFDNEDNVFGGYMNELIYKKDSHIEDLKSYTFSLIRNGKVKNKKYTISEFEKNYAFCLYSNNDYLYIFGKKFDNSNDICVPKIGYKSEYSCKPYRYKYNWDQRPLRDETNDYYMKRILVIEMC